MHNLTIPACCLFAALMLSTTAAAYDCPYDGGHDYSTDSCDFCAKNAIGDIECETSDYNDFIRAVCEDNEPTIWGYADSPTDYFCCEPDDLDTTCEALFIDSLGRNDVIWLSYAGLTWDNDSEIDAGSGDDTVYGGDNSSFADTIFAGSGDDNVYGRAGNDYIYGLAGDDHLEGQDGSDHIWGGWDHNEIDGGDGVDYLYGNRGVDEIKGGGSADTIEGGAGDDKLCGGSGLDAIDGGAGSDYCSQYFTESYCEVTPLSCNFIYW